MSRWKCGECGADLELHYIPKSKVFSISGKHQSITRKQKSKINDKPQLLINCSNDSNHKIEPQNPTIEQLRDFNTWMDFIICKFQINGPSDETIECII